MKLSPQITGNTGLYYCCYKLSLLGWNVMPTARNARGVDIIAYDEDATKMLAIQVKSLSKRNPVPLGLSLDKVSGDFWIIINKVSVDPCAFIMLCWRQFKIDHLCQLNFDQGSKAGFVVPGCG